MPAEETTAKPAPAKKRRLWLKVLGVAAVILVLVVILLPYLVPKTWLAAAVAKAVKQNVNRPVILGEVSWGWLGGIRIKDVTVGEAPAFGQGSFVKADEIDLHVSLLDLLWKEVNVQSVTIVSPRVAVIRNQEGAWNFDNLLVTQARIPHVAIAAVVPAESGSANFSINQVRISGGDVLFEDRKESLTYQARDVTASVDADFAGPAIKGDAKVTFALEQGGAAPARFELAASNVSVPKNAQGAEALAAATAAGTLTLKGIDISQAVAATMPQYGKDFASGTLTIAVDYKLQGKDVTLAANKGTVQGLVLGKSLVAGGPVKVGDVTVSLDSTITQGEEYKATFRSLSLATPFANVSGSGTATFGGKEMPLSAKLSGTVMPSDIPAGLVALPADLQTTGPLRFDATVDAAPAPINYSVTADAGSMAVRYGDVLNKQAGTAARVAAKGTLQGQRLTADTLEVTLTGGSLQGSGAYDMGTSAASWNLVSTLDKLDVNNYYPGSKGLLASGTVKTTGQLAAPAGQPLQYSIDTNVTDLAVDATGTPGTEAVVSGALAMNTQQAQTQNLVVNVAGKPLTVTAVIQRPLEAPTGKVTVRGQEVNVDSVMAMAAALQSTLPAPKPAAPATRQPGQAPPQQPPASDTLMKKANIDATVNVDRVVYQGYNGSNLVVDASVRNGTLAVRQATVNIFGGSIDLTTTYNIAGAKEPFDLSLNVAKVQASQPAASYMTSFMPGLGFDGTADLNFKASGQTGVAQSVLNTLTGGGQLDVTNGAFKLAGIPDALAALLNVNLKDLSFSNLQIPIKVADGAVSYAYTIPAGRESVVIEGKKMLGGGYTQQVAYQPQGASSPIHLLSVTNGAMSFVRPEQLVADLAKAKLLGGGVNLPGLGGLQPGGAQPQGSLRPRGGRRKGVVPRRATPPGNRQPHPAGTGAPAAGRSAEAATSAAGAARPRRPGAPLMPEACATAGSSEGVL